ncbi:MAG: T9SS type A sorting domain-containing protein, partial [Flammeovirgaceae bacterium]
PNTFDDISMESNPIFQGVFQNQNLPGRSSSTLTAQSALLPGSGLTAGPYFLSSGSNYRPPASSSQIATFCNTIYSTDAIRSNFRLATEDDDSMKPENKSNSSTAFPNPTTGKLSFRYYIEEPTQVRLNITSTTGSILGTPVDAYQEAGPYEVSYDASHLPAGVYIYTLETSKGKETKRLVIIK